MRTLWLLFAFVVVSEAINLSNEAEKDRPVSRVIALLRKMHKQMQEDQEKEEELFAKMECYCRNTKKEKSAAVEKAKQHILQCESVIKETAANKAKLEVQRKQLEEDIAEMKAALREKDEMRRKDSEAFHQEHKASLTSIQQLKNAINILKKHHGGAALLQAKKVIRWVMWRNGDVVKADHRAALGSFVQINPSSYNSASGEIFGILQDMQDTMERDLGDAKKAEDSAASNHAAWAQSKSEEMKAAKEQLANVKTDHANAVGLLTSTKKDLEGTTATLDADEKFAAELELACQKSGNEWDLRQKLRGEEMTAVSEAIKILSDDDAHDQFNKSVNKESVTAFVQVSRHSAVRTRVFNQLKKIAKNGSKESALLLLAVGGPFDAIVKKIGELVEDKKQEAKDDEDKRDYCESDLHSTNVEKKEETHNNENLTAKIENLEAQIEQLNKEIAEHNAEIAENQKNFKEASEQRAKETAEYKEMVANQNAAKAILAKAQAKLKAFYDKKGNAFFQQPQVGGMSMKAYDTNAGSTSVIQLIQNIMDECDQTVEDGTKAENDANAEYAKLTEDTNATISDLQANVAQKTETVASSTAEKVQAKQDLSTSQDNLDALNNKLNALHSECDWLIANFETRRQAREEEIQAMQEAASTLQGAQLPGNVQIPENA